MANVQRWHAEVRVDIRPTARQVCIDTENALGQAKDWLANEMTEDFKRHATTEDVRRRIISIADDHAAYDGLGKGWEGWFIAPDEDGPSGTLVHYRLTPCDGCDISGEFA